MWVEYAYPLQARTVQVQLTQFTKLFFTAVNRLSVSKTQQQVQHRLTQHTGKS